MNLVKMQLIQAKILLITLLKIKAQKRQIQVRVISAELSLYSL